MDSFPDSPPVAVRADLALLPRTLFNNPTAKHFYDQIAWFTGANGAPNLSPHCATRASAGTGLLPRR